MALHQHVGSKCDIDMPALAQAISRGITKSGVGVQTLNLEQCRCGTGTALSASQT